MSRNFWWQPKEKGVRRRRPSSVPAGLPVIGKIVYPTDTTAVDFGEQQSQLLWASNINRSLIALQESSRSSVPDWLDIHHCELRYSQTLWWKTPMKVNIIKSLQYVFILSMWFLQRTMTNTCPNSLWRRPSAFWPHHSSTSPTAHSLSPFILCSSHQNLPWSLQPEEHASAFLVFCVI